LQYKNFKVYMLPLSDRCELWMGLVYLNQQRSKQGKVISNEKLYTQL